jgi:molybdenum cofactor cytidylyltransferase
VPFGRSGTFRFYPVISVNRQPSTFRSFAIVPAAGRSTRMGQPKLLLPWRGSSMIEAQLAAWRASRVTATIVIVHPEDAQLAAVCRRAGAEVVVAETAPPTMKASVLLGLDHLIKQYAPRQGDAWLLAPADMPMLSEQLIDQVLAAYDPDHPQIMVPQYHSERGHPVLFPWRLVEEVRGLSADEGLNVLRRRHGGTQVQVADAGILADIDTPAEYQRLHGGDVGLKRPEPADVPRPT